MATKPSKTWRHKYKRFYPSLIGLGIILLLACLIGIKALAKPAVVSKVGTPYLISLGGSIAAGAGLRGTYKGPYHLPLACEQTDQSYPVILGHDLHMPLLQVACSGAQTSSGLFKHQIIKHRSLRPQLIEVEPKIRSSVVTVFIGANDVQWIPLENTCFSRGCPDQDPSIFSRGLTTTSHNITDVITHLHLYGAKAILINEYYTAITSGNAMACGKYHLTAEDVTRYQSMLQQLNTAITTGYEMADISSAYLVPLNFSQHGICSPHPWVQGLLDLQPFHPTAGGQEAIAQADDRVLLMHKL